MSTSNRGNAQHTVDQTALPRLTLAWNRTPGTYIIRPDGSKQRLPMRPLNVYFAGDIAPNDWRHRIAPDLRGAHWHDHTDNGGWIFTGEEHLLPTLRRCWIITATERGRLA
jgi:hypothetical protein